MFVQAYLNSTKEILSQYKGEEPLPSYLKKYFALNKKYGSRDRRQIAHLCYCFFRLGKSLMDVPIEKKLLLGIFLCDKDKSTLLQRLDPQLDEEAGNSLGEKILKLKNTYNFKE
jgi:16S rRNA (cytosine967-C5)-methyltransferase